MEYNLNFTITIEADTKLEAKLKLSKLLKGQGYNIR